MMIILYLLYERSKFACFNFSSSWLFKFLKFHFYKSIYSLDDFHVKRCDDNNNNFGFVLMRTQMIASSCIGTFSLGLFLLLVFRCCYFDANENTTRCPPIDKWRIFGSSSNFLGCRFFFTLGFLLLTIISSPLVFDLFHFAAPMQQYEPKTQTKHLLKLLFFEFFTLISSILTWTPTHSLTHSSQVSASSICFLCCFPLSVHCVLSVLPRK